MQQTFLLAEKVGEGLERSKILFSKVTTKLD